MSPTLVPGLAAVAVSFCLLSCRDRVASAADEAALKTDLRTMRDVIDQYYGDSKHYPPKLEDLVTAGYLRALPTDPMTRSSATWTVVREGPEFGGTTGIIDVHSGSTARARDGTRYADW